LIFCRKHLVFIIACRLQINVQNLEKGSFWARINEESLAKDDIFKGLMANFSTKVIGWFVLLCSVNVEHRCFHYHVLHPYDE